MNFKKFLVASALVATCGVTVVGCTKGGLESMPEPPVIITSKDYEKRPATLKVVVTLAKALDPWTFVFADGNIISDNEKKWGEDLSDAFKLVPDAERKVWTMELAYDKEVIHLERLHTTYEAAFKLMLGTEKGGASWAYEDLGGDRNIILETGANIMEISDAKFKGEPADPNSAFAGEMNIHVTVKDPLKLITFPEGVKTLGFGSDVTPTAWNPTANQFVSNSTGTMHTLTFKYDNTLKLAGSMQFKITLGTTWDWAIPEDKRVIEGVSFTDPAKLGENANFAFANQAEQNIVYTLYDETTVNKGDIAVKVKLLDPKGVVTTETGVPFFIGAATGWKDDAVANPTNYFTKQADGSYEFNLTVTNTAGDTKSEFGITNGKNKWAEKYWTLEYGNSNACIYFTSEATAEITYTIDKLVIAK